MTDITKELATDLLKDYFENPDQQLLRVQEAMDLRLMVTFSKKGSLKQVMLTREAFKELMILGLKELSK